jgi:DeoR family fructose operon transcriptional repressor
VEGVVNMFIEERLEKILQLVRQEGRVSVKEAHEFLGVSEDTVRRDFTRLSEKSLVVRTHGGVMSKDRVSFDPGMKEKTVQHQQEKEKIARLAATKVDDGDVIIIDAGTTTERMIQYIAEHQDLTVLTDALNIAVETTKRNIHTIILGGDIRISTLSVTGPDAVDMIKHYHADKLFMGVSAISINKGLMTPNRLEAEIKRGLIDISTDVVVLADHSKIDRTSLFSFGTLNDISYLVTDWKADNTFIDELKDSEIEVLIAQE